MVVFDGGFSEPLWVTTHREFMQEGTIKHGDLTWFNHHEKLAYIQEQTGSVLVKSGSMSFFCAISAFLPILAGYPWSAGTHEQQNHVFVADMAMVQNHVALVSTSKQLTAMFILFNVVNPRINNPQLLDILLLIMIGYTTIFGMMWLAWPPVMVVEWDGDYGTSFTTFFWSSGRYWHILGAGTARTIQLLGRRQRLPLSGRPGTKNCRNPWWIQLGHGIQSSCLVAVFIYE